LVGAILKILCPRERRIFQSKLGVSSSNQCNLHHSPHTGHLGNKNTWEIKIKMGTIFSGHPVFELNVKLRCRKVKEHTVHSLADSAVECVTVTDRKGWGLRGRLRIRRGFEWWKGQFVLGPGTGGGMGTGLRTGQPRGRSSIRGRGKRWSDCVEFPASYSLVMRSFSPWVKRTESESHFHLVLRLWIRGTVPPVCMAWWRVWGQLYLLFVRVILI
jgi:hypothetical protein